MDERSGHVLIVLPLGRDAELAAQSLQQAGLQTKICADVHTLVQSLSTTTAVLLLGEEALSAQNLEDILQVLRNQSAWSDLPILLLNKQRAYGSREIQVTRRLMEVTSVTIMDRPLRKVTLISTVQAALRARQRQWQVRDLLEQRESNAQALLEAKQQAEAANRAKDDFMASLSHELRTPLTPALMTVATLRHDDRLPLDVREELAVVERNISLESRLIDDLLDLTRISKGKLPLRPELCDAHSLLAHVVGIVRDDALSKGLRLDLELKAAKSGLVVDAARLQQVAWNLLKNAVKFTPHGGTITLRTFNRDQSLIMEVADTGIGFETQNAEKMFRRFEQLNDGHSFGGLGLGLAISRALVEMHGGTIRAHSAGPKQGAVFEVTLPDAREAPRKIEDTPSLQGLNVGKNLSLKVLLVEDHTATLAVLQRLLRRDGHSVTTATSVAEAVEKVQGDQPFDVLITDLGLPDGTGIDVMEQLRLRRPELRGVVLSGYGMEDDQARTVAAGFSAHLVKPIAFDQLQRVLQSLGQPGDERSTQQDGSYHDMSQR